MSRGMEQDFRDNSGVDVDDLSPERRASPSREFQVSSRGFFLIKEEPQVASTRASRGPYSRSADSYKCRCCLVRAFEEASACRLCCASVSTRLCQHMKKENNGICII